MPNDERFFERLADFGHESGSRFTFEMLGASFDTADPGFVYPKEVLRTVGKAQHELYYYCVLLQSKGFRLPGYLSWSSLRSRMRAAGLMTDYWTRIDLVEQERALRELVRTEDNEEGESLPPRTARDDFVGTVSFRAECKHDVEQLFESLRRQFTGAWEVVQASRRAGEPLDELERMLARIEPDVELVIRAPLTIARLYDAMAAVEHGRVMSDTLRALPLEKNSLVRRYSDAKPDDWTSQDDGC